MINKKNQEILFIQGKEFAFGEKITCENYNTLKLQVAKKRQSSKYTFLQLGKLSPAPNLVKFFLAIAKKTKAEEFKLTHIISITLRIS